jgi:hypothetical protein
MNMDTHTDNKRYFAKEGTWFKAGTECKLIEDFEGMNGGLYRGIYIVGENGGYATFWHNKGYKEDDEVEMNEFCRHDEFDVIS